MPFCIGNTRFGGAVLLLPFALGPSATAGAMLAKQPKSEDGAQRLMLSLFFRTVIGIERSFHFETLSDRSFALLTGGLQVVFRSRQGGWAHVAMFTTGLPISCRRADAARNQVDRYMSIEHPVDH